ncbi:MAG: toxin-antitoxin system YwqK family antitoxin, partial [Candidatus Kapabacteria bacterium]|nr:toxin-antitoxin system YwqK family antitoxin [Candidatus Kapabacteria bacterium]
MSRLLRSVIVTTLMCMVAVVAVAQNPKNKTNSEGRQGPWKVWLTRSMEEALDSTSAPYYRLVTYKDGKETGPFSDFFASDKLFRKGHLVEHNSKVQIEGAVEVYRESGTLEAKENYVRGTRTGVYTKYSIGGAITLEGEFDDGRRTGLWTTFYESGQVKTRGNYLDNNQDGEWISYFEDGRVKETTLYTDGKLMDWSRLLELCESISDAARLSDGLRYWNQARSAIQSGLGEHSLAMARLHLARVRIAWIEKNEPLALRHLDTAFSIYSSFGVAARQARRSGVDKILKFANEQLAIPIITRTFPEVQYIFKNDSVIGYTEASSLCLLVGLSSVNANDRTMLQHSVTWSASVLPSLALLKDSTYAREMFTHWQYLASCGMRLSDQTLYKVCKDYAEAVPGISVITDIESLRNKWVSEVISDIASNKQLTWQEQKSAFYEYIQQNKSVEESQFCRLLVSVASEVYKRHDFGFLRQIINEFPPTCQMDSSNGGGLIYSTSLVVIYLTEGRCDSAKAQFEKVRPFAVFFDSLAFVQKLEQAVIACDASNDSVSIVTLQPLFTDPPDTTLISLNEALSLIV